MLALEVSDIRDRMESGDARRIFDPFFNHPFTRRGLGSGGGAGIVRGHEGAIRREERPVREGTFRILLPAGGGRPEPAPERARSQPAGPWNGIAGTILVAGRREGGAGCGAGRLGALGFPGPPPVATDAKGIRSSRQNRGEVVAVVIDLTMPLCSAAARGPPGRPTPWIHGPGGGNQRLLGRPDPGPTHRIWAPTQFLRQPWDAPKGLRNTLRGLLGPEGSGRREGEEKTEHEGTAVPR